METNLLVEGFYTALDHIFATRYLPEPNEKGETVLERYNGGGATVAGVNVEAKAAFSRWFDLQAGITWQRSRYEHAQHWSDDAPDEHRMFRSPDWYGYLTANFVPVRRFDISLSGTYTGEMLVQHAAGSGTPVDVAVTTPDFFALNVKLAYEFPILRTLTLQLNAGVQNLFDSYQSDFDQGWERDSGYGLRAVAAAQLVRRGENPLLRTVAATHEKRETCVRHVSLIVRRRRTRLTPTPRNGARRLSAQPAGRPRRSRPSREYVPSDRDGTYCLRYRCADRAPRAPGTTCRPPYNDRSRNRDGSRRA